MVTDALECIPECLAYMNLLKTPEIFRFCAITQVMAIATLAELYNNPLVLTGVVKIRKGLAVKLINETRTEQGLYKWFYRFSKQIHQSVKPSDPNAEKTLAACEKVFTLTEKHAK